jgi:hypothetical protein
MKPSKRPLKLIFLWVVFPFIIIPFLVIQTFASASKSGIEELVDMLRDLHDAMKEWSLFWIDEDN